jgi:hypothetical protein
MSHARRAGWAAITIGLVAGIAACSDAMSSFESDSGKGSGSDAGRSNSDNNSAAPSGAGQPTASGVLLVHAASFPSFRLCFENLPDALPQPDSRVMPQANVVGVEIGSVVRIDPLVSPGKVYVFRESKIREEPGAEHPRTCGQLLQQYEANFEYQVATKIEEPLGKSEVSVLAITGCGGQSFLDLVGASNDTCGADWDSSSGNLQAKTFTIPVQKRSTDTLPVQLFQMSRQLDALGGDAGTLSVTFGQLTADASVPAPLEQPVPTAPLYEAGPSASLTFDQSSASTYADHGFRITAGAFSTDQSLASVQELSAPLDLPTDYFQAASSYALLLLGDPAHKPTLGNGDPNPKYNPRQAVHILAVPVIDPNADAGADSGDLAEEPTPGN